MCWSIFPLFYCQFLSSLIGKKNILKWDKLWKYGGGVNSGAKGRRFEVRSVAWTSKQINIIFCQMGVTAACGSISPYNTAHDLCNWLLSAHATTVLTPHLSPHPWSAYRVLFECRSLLAEWFCFFFLACFSGLRDLEIPAWSILIISFITTRVVTWPASASSVILRLSMH